MSCTLKSNGSILSTILMMTLILIISFIKAICFLTTRTQQYHYIENCMSLIPWGNDNPFLSAMMFTLFLTFNSSFLKGLLFYSNINTYRGSIVSYGYYIWDCGACILSASWCNQYQGSRIAYIHKIKKFPLNFHHEDSYTQY